MHPNTELDAIARYTAGKSKSQIQPLRDSIMAEVARLEATFPERAKSIDDPSVFSLQRDRGTCARRRAEVAYLNTLLDGPSVLGVPTSVT